MDTNSPDNRESQSRFVDTQPDILSPSMVSVETDTQIDFDVDALEEEFENAGETLLEIEKFIDTDLQNISVGPRYVTKTSRGVEVQITTAFKTGREDNEPTKTILFIARDTKGNLLGHRTTYLVEEEEEFHGTGNVNIVKRDMGIVMPLELANIDILDRYAQQTGKDIYYQVINGNANNLEWLQERYSKLIANYKETAQWQNQKQYLEESIKKNEAEQLRWQQVWGPNGKLGYNANNIKIHDHSYDPREERLDIEDTESIQLERTVKNAIVTPHVNIIKEFTGDKEQRQISYIQELKSILRQSS